MQYNTKSIANTATLIFSGNQARAGFILHNAGSQDIYLGGDSSVASSTGIPIAPGEKILADGSSAYNGTLYGIVASGTADLRFMEWGENDVG